MIERIFIGWSRPVLHSAADVLAERYAVAGQWKLGAVLIVLPGRQAGRRLREILEAQARERHLRLALPEIVTPAELMERLYTSPTPIASPAESLCAWLRAVQHTPVSDRETLMPSAPDADGPLAGTRLAELAAHARAELMAERLTLAETTERCAALPGFCDDRRWAALAPLEARYQEILARAGRVDQHDARRAALHTRTLACPQDIVLVGTVDLNAIEAALLRSLATPVTALIPAPAALQEGFDDIGGLIREFWHSQPLTISEDRLCFPASPTAEAFTVAAEVASLTKTFAPSQIHLGVGDERDADGLARRLAARCLPTRSPYGLRLSRTRPVVLLRVLRDFLTDPSARGFAALVRHPDLENFLGGDAALLDRLDQLLAERLPEQMPADLPPPVDAAYQAVMALLAPLHDTHPLPNWAAPLKKILDAVYGAEEPGEDAEGRQLRRSLQHMEAALQDLTSIATALAPRLSGHDALTFLLRRLDGPRLPDDAHADGMEMQGWLELAWDDAPALLLTGLHDGAVPTGNAADPLLTDALRRHLGLPDARRRQARDSFLLRVILESRPHVSLFAARRGADGEPRRPSRLLFLCDGETAARRALRFAAGEAAAVSTEEGPSREGPLFPSGAARRLPPPRPEPLSVPLTRLRVTAFRDYLACPYRFYLRHVLKLDEQDDSEDEMSAARFGDLLHACLASLARSSVAEAPLPGPIQEYLRGELRRQIRGQFGEELPAPVRLQVRQAERRLDRFARWQADQTAAGWLIQRDFVERDLEAEMRVDDLPFTLTGRLDRVDYHPGEDIYRILDYKTGDSGGKPDAKHRGKAGEDGQRPWTDLQLPLYRRLAVANGVAPDRLGVGYALLPADLAGVGDAPAAWSEQEFLEADARAEEVIRAIRREVFWPPTAPARYPDALSPLCLDRCRDREAWFGEEPVS